MFQRLITPAATLIGFSRALKQVFAALRPNQLVLCDLPTKHLYWIDPKRKILRIANGSSGRFDPTADDDLTMDVSFGEGTSKDLCARDRIIWEMLARAAGDNKALRKLRRAGDGDSTMPNHWSDGVPRIDKARIYPVRLSQGDQPVPDPQLATLS